LTEEPFYVNVNMNISGELQNSSMSRL